MLSLLFKHLPLPEQSFIQLDKDIVNFIFIDILENININHN
jgi:hypothetical protein